MLHIVMEGPPQFVTRFTADRSSGVIVLRSDKPFKGNSFQDAIAELESTEAKQRAAGFAVTQGVADARLSPGGGGVYPCVKGGIPLDQVRDEHGQSIPLTDPRCKIDHYRIDIPVTRRLL
jgi:hypothetical protein